MMEKIINYLQEQWPAYAISLSIYLFAKTINLIRNNKQKKNNNRDQIASAIDEIDYNLAPGVGDDKKPFSLDHLKKLQENSLLEPALKNEIKNLVLCARICPTKYKPGQIKNALKPLRQNLQKN